MAPRTWRVAVFVLVLAIGLAAVTGCDSAGPVAGPTLPPPTPSSAAPSEYVPPPLPTSCESVLAEVDLKKAGDLRWKGAGDESDPVEETSGPTGKNSLFCGFWGSAHAGKLTFNLRFHLMTHSPDPITDTVEEVDRWARDRAQQAAEGICAGKPEIVDGSRYTVRCIRKNSATLIASRAVVGKRLQVSSAEIDMEYLPPVTQQQANERAELTLRAIVEAGLNAE